MVESEMMMMMTLRVLRVLPQQLPPRDQNQPPPLSQPEAAAAPAAVLSGQRALFGLLGRRRPRGRPLPSVHQLDGLLHGQVSGPLRAAQVVGQDVRGHDGSEGRDGLGAPEELDLGSGARVDLLFCFGEKNGRSFDRESESEFICFAFLFFSKNFLTLFLLPWARRLSTAPRR